MTSVIIIRGPMGVGKSTVARALCKQIDATHISLDVVMHNLKLDTPDEDGISLANFVEGNSELVRLVQACSGTVVIDGNFYYQKQIDDLVERLGLLHSWIYLQAPLEVCMKRNRSRAKPYSDAAVKFLYQIVSEVNYGKVLDTQSRTVEEIVNEILK